MPYPANLGPTNVFKLTFQNNYIDQGYSETFYYQTNNASPIQDVKNAVSAYATVRIQGMGNGPDFPDDPNVAAPYIYGCRIEFCDNGIPNAPAAVPPTFNSATLGIGTGQSAYAEPDEWPLGGTAQLKNLPVDPWQAILCRMTDASQTLRREMLFHGFPRSWIVYPEDYTSLNTPVAMVDWLQAMSNVLTNTQPNVAKGQNQFTGNFCIRYRLDNPAAAPPIITYTVQSIELDPNGYLQYTLQVPVNFQFLLGQEIRFTKGKATTRFNVNGVHKVTAQAYTAPVLPATYATLLVTTAYRYPTPTIGTLIGSMKAIPLFYGYAPIAVTLMANPAANLALVPESNRKKSLGPAFGSTRGRARVRN